MQKWYELKTASMLCLMIITAALAGPAEAIFKCTTPKGVVYQDRPCREGNETDVQIVVPTGEVARRQVASPDEATQPGGAPPASRSAPLKPGRTSADDPNSVSKPVEKRPNEASAISGDSSRKKDSRASTDNSGGPTIPEPARNTDPSARYYATEGFGTGTDTPGRLTCESATGEKRVFYLSNGKLMSI
jgi:hypothetical protein